MQRLISLPRACATRHCLPCTMFTSPTSTFCLPALAGQQRFIAQDNAYAPSSSTGRRPYPRKGGEGFGRGGGAGRANATSSSHASRDRSRPRGGPIKDRYPPMLASRSDPRRRLAVLVDGTNSSLLRAGHTAGGDVGAAIRQGSPLYTAVLPAIVNVGVPVLLRVFAHELPAEWGPLLAGTPAFASGPGREGHTAPGASASVTLLPLNASPTGSSLSSSAAASSTEEPQIQFEFFRVERFIPIPMQIEADAQHLYDFRHHNLIEGVCYVCHEVDRGMYESIMEEQLKGSFLSTNAAAAAVQATAWLSSSRPAAATEAGESAGATSSATSAAFFNQYLLDELGMVKEMNLDARPGDGS